MKYFIPFLLLLVFASCSSPEKADNEGPKPQIIVCTTGMLGDLVSNIVGSSVQVKSLMGPGVDPHLYKATQGDLKALMGADVIVYNGLHLEGKMGEVLEKIAKTKPVIPAAEILEETELLKLQDGSDAIDPHVWFDVEIWSQIGQSLGDTLRAYFPEHALEIKEQTDNYVSTLLGVDEWVSRNLSEIPDEQRVLVTAHDAFGYFSRAYGFEVKALQGISTVAEFGLRDVTDLVDFITSRNIKALFLESSIPERSMNAVLEGCKKRGHEVTMGGTLFSDALGDANSEEGTYIGVVHYNVNTIASALK